MLQRAVAAAGITSPLRFPLLPAPHHHLRSARQFYFRQHPPSSAHALLPPAPGFALPTAPPFASSAAGRCRPAHSISASAASAGEFMAESAAGAAAAGAGGAGVAMEVEVKLRLPNKEAHARVAELLAASHRVTHQQENVFFDGANGELSRNRIVLRLRFYNNDAKCVVTVKGKTVMADGIGRSTEEEEDIDPTFGRACVKDPSLLQSASTPLLSSLPNRFSCPEYVCLGGFRNTRGVFEWRGNTIELDETQFAFGTQYEIECETSQPEKLKAELGVFLQEHSVPFSNSSSTKFGIFRAGKLPEY
ncbi:hypothetical protein CLOM_g13495 [Closterium sp. NIES-68]|nr:hypothetical protein CLOM_g13495 [Closterium sp. NIES-68]GJP86708.1 hypothetical protein CLOP_g16705 [Closterium sp. NIES-67]